MIKRIIFDLDNTLIIPNYYDMQKYLKETFYENYDSIMKNVNKVLFSYEQEFDRYEKIELHKYINNHCKINMTKEDFEGLLDTTINIPQQDFSESKNILRYLKSKGYEIVILTNWFKDIQYKKLKIAGLSEYVDELYSGDMFLKPSRESFENALGNNKTEECIMIGDNFNTDILGAMKYGIKAIYLNKNKEDIEKNIIQITNIKELKEFL